LSGYTPVFDTVYDGTLCGKWPTLPVWLSILPMADWRGHIDLTPEAISARTGWPMELLLAGIKQLCEPDPRSRSKNDDGRRLVLLDEHRDWGWRVINIQKYRNIASGKDQVDDGRNAEKVRRYKERQKTLKDTVGHRETPQNTNSDTYTNSDSDSEKDTTAQAPSDHAPEFVDFKISYPNRAGDQGWRKAQRAINARISEGYTWNQIVDGAKRYAAYVRATDSEGTQYVKQACVFVGPDLHFLSDWKPPANKAERRLDSNLSAAEEFLRRTEPTDETV
jgi:hypothetical protein